MDKIAVVGTGYVGLVTGACLSDFGLNVTCVDNNSSKIERLKHGEIPIYEPGLDIIVDRNIFYKRLNFTTDIKSAIEECQVIFIAVGTPPCNDGSADLQYVEAVANEIATHMNEYKVIVNKSTVPVGTGQLVKTIIQQKLVKRGTTIDFDVVSNPEFLREGSAVYDFTHPDRVVIGSESEKSREIMKNVYRVLYLNETPFIDVNLETAEMIKYAANAFLAMKITFINEMANLCEKVGANVQNVAKAVGRDGRIGSKFLHPGPGYGGSCFPKDTMALAYLGRKYESRVSIIEATIEANDKQKKLMAKKIEDKLTDVKDKTIAILGLAFKPNTDDVRDAPALTIINELYKMGALFRVFDPVAMAEAKDKLRDIDDRITFCEDEYETARGSYALVIVTEWNQFRNLDLKMIKEKLKEPLFFDLRNIYQREQVEAYGLEYIGVGQ